MGGDKEVIVASALIVIFYWLFMNKSAQAAATAVVTAEGTKQTISTEGTTGVIGECSHIFIEYPGLAIFTPCTNNSTTLSNSSDMDSYIKSLKASS